MYHLTVSETVINNLEFFLIYKSYSRSKCSDVGIYFPWELIKSEDSSLYSISGNKGKSEIKTRYTKICVKLKSFSAFGARLWNCLHPDWRKLTKRAFKRKLHKLLFTVLGIEDYYVDAHSLILKFNANNYCTLSGLCFATCFV